MKRLLFAGLCGLCAWLAACQTTQTTRETTSERRHESRFGYAAEIPAAWLAVEAADLAQRTETAVPAFANVDPELLADIERALAGGEVEVFFRPGPTPGGFVDNVSVRPMPGGLPDEEDDVEASCEVLTETLSSAYGRPVALSVCEIRRVARRRSLYVEATGAVDGIHSLQYLIERPSGSLIVVTGTALTGTLPSLRSELAAMVSSLELE